MANLFDEVTGYFKPDPALLKAYTAAEDTMRYINADDAVRDALRKHLSENADDTGFWDSYDDPEFEWVLKEYLDDGEQEQYLKDILSDVIADMSPEDAEAEIVDD